MKIILQILVLGLLIFSSCALIKNPKQLQEQDALQSAWKRYHKTIEEVEDDFVSSKIYQLDSIHQIGAYELLSMLIAANQNFIMSDPDYTNFHHMENPIRRIGIDNPDNFYRSANVWNPDGNYVYRVWGNRGTTADFLMETFYGADPKGAIAVLEDEDMVIDENGDFEVYLSAIRKPYMKNWMELEKDNRILALIVRSNHAEWDKERHGDVFIERVGMTGTVYPGPTKTGLIQRINNAQQVLERQGKFWPNFAWKMTLMKKNSLMEFKTTGEIGILSQKSSYGYWELEDDEALVVKLKEVDAGYCGFQTLNFWGSSPDWRNKFTSLSWGRDGKCQAHKSSDGFYYIVVSKNDPGIQNWIETSGMKKGVMTLRIQSLRDLEFKFKPITQVVKMSNLKNYLPKDMPDYTAEQRSEQLKVRQQHALDRYVYW
ncbi:hypothetical protein E9993_08345 [Labilibacter sediminis]|nr:hypothetical protein E9993_08345 [Labilibacter sediminis]